MLTPNSCRHRPDGARRQRQRGITILESLVAIVVLALGILGLAGIQTRVLADSRTTNARAVAVRMAEDLAERMQFNSAIRLANPAINPNPYVVAWAAQPAAVDCTTNLCNPTQLANDDLSQWKATLGTLLPGGDAMVFQSPTDPRQFGVLIGWDANTGAAALADAATYSQPLQVVTGVAGATCAVGQECHLIYILP